jgi:WD40 repeat protein
MRPVRQLVATLLFMTALSGCNMQSSPAATWTPPAPTGLPETASTPTLGVLEAPPTAEAANGAPVIDLANVDQLAIVGRLEPQGDLITQLAFSPDGRFLAVASDRIAVEIWDISTSSLVTELTGHRAATAAVAFSRDGRTLATGSWDKTIRLWDTSAWSLITQWSAHDSYLTALAYSPDGSLIASGGEDDAVNIWPAQGGERLFHLLGSGISVGSLAFSPAGDILVSAYGDSQARVWSLTDGTLLRSLVGFSTTRSLTFSDDGALLAGGSWSYSPETLKPLGRIAFFDVDSGERLYGTEFNTGALEMAFSLDGSLLFSTTSDDEDFRLRAWRTSDGAFLVDFRPLDGRPYALARNNAGTLLATGAQGGTILLWGIEP